STRGDSRSPVRRRAISRGDGNTGVRRGGGLQHARAPLDASDLRDQWLVERLHGRGREDSPAIEGDGQGQLPASPRSRSATDRAAYAGARRALRPEGRYGDGDALARRTSVARESRWATLRRCTARPHGGVLTRARDYRRG